MTTPRASLPMYALAALADDHRALWQGIRRRLAAAGVAPLPERLEEGAGEDAWTDPGLLLSQTCGYPLVTRLRGRVRVVATPCHAAAGCAGPRYRSWIIARDGDRGEDLASFRQRRAAINGRDSLSGYHALTMMLPGGQTPEQFFSQVRCCAAHRGSIASVRGGEADVAAIDCVTWALLAAYHPEELRGLRIVDRGPLLPALPLVTSIDTADTVLDLLRRALVDTVADPGFARHRARLRLVGVVPTDETFYADIAARLHPDGADA